LKNRAGLEPNVLDYCTTIILWYFCKKGTAIITDPYGKFERKVKAPNDGYVINATIPDCLKGDAIYHLSNTNGDEE
jgi:hypothetical protein